MRWKSLYRAHNDVRCATATTVQLNNWVLRRLSESCSGKLFSTAGLTSNYIYIHTGWPNKNCTFFRYHIFVATTDIIILFCWSVQKLQQKTTSDNFFKWVLYSLQSNRKWTTPQLTSSAMISQDLVTLPQTSSQNNLPWSFVLKVDILSIAWIRLNKAYTDCDKTLWHTSKLLLCARYRILTSLQRIFNTRVKKIVASCFLM